MAYLKYNPSGSSGITYNIDNDTLAAIQRVMTERFAEGQGFWLESDESSAIWLHPTIPVLVQYDEDQEISYSHEMVDVMVDGSRLPYGLSLGANSVSSRINVTDPDWQRAADDSAEESAS